MLLADFKTLYWQAVGALPAAPRQTSFSSRLRSLIVITRSGPTGFGQRLVHILVLSTQQQGYALNDPATLHRCHSRLQRSLPPGGEFLLSDTPGSLSFTEATLKSAVLARLAWRLLLNSQ